MDKILEKLLSVNKIIQCWIRFLLNECQEIIQWPYSTLNKTLIQHWIRVLCPTDGGTGVTLECVWEISPHSIWSPLGSTLTQAVKVMSYKHTGITYNLDELCCCICCIPRKKYHCPPHPGSKHILYRRFRCSSRISCSQTSELIITRTL